MVGGDAVDGAVLEATPQGLAVLGVPDGRVHHQSGAALVHVAIIEGEMLGADLGGNQIALVRS